MILQNYIPLLNKALKNDELTAITDITWSTEKNEYYACTFTLGSAKIVFREAKVTPKKIGLFVAIWRRNEDNITTPYHIDDNFDYFVIGTGSGCFVYPKSILVELQIISSNLKEGKRGMRVYPNLEVEMNKQALKTYQSHLPFYYNF
ncbi:MepB family protein [Myroides marinus]|uniref:MepB family protein n=1 Tax=Myroides marinus TaxID=703342 RepID=UPI0025755F42|nr:MepB family protein [Myroides marinus]MDM1380540.1 MepB family protein [Myroides marinus]MDM1387783.1 MepB family protein [Myroides marinus]MDM1395024.1 MepB family protein [Myroides marinus]